MTVRVFGRQVEDLVCIYVNIPLVDRQVAENFAGSIQNCVQEVTAR